VCGAVALTRRRAAAWQRHEREVWAAKNADRLAREATVAALAADKEARREAAARAAAAQGKPPPESKLA
jgi:hypothetical protein